MAEASAIELEALPSMGGLYRRAATASVLPFGGGGSELPDTVISLTGISAESGAVADYARVCGFTLRDTLPATYPHVPAFALQLELMTSKRFPFDLLGLVHLANRIEQRRPLRVDEPFDLRVWSEDLRPHRRGKQVDLVSEASVDGETVWLDRSTYLRRGKDGEESAADESLGVEPADGWTEAVWALPGDLGRRYAAVSGDRNPIHLNRWTAKAFGFPRAIAHGMWSKARALAAFDGSVPDEFTIAVEFKAPVLLPSKPRFRSTPAGDGFEFALLRSDGEREHLTGRIIA